MNSVSQLQAFPSYRFIVVYIKIIYVGLSKQTLNQVFIHHSHYKSSIAAIGTKMAMVVCENFAEEYV